MWNNLLFKVLTYLLKFPSKFYAQEDPAGLFFGFMQPQDTPVNPLGL